LASTMRLTMANRSNALRARRSMRVTVTPSPGGKAVEHAEKLGQVGSRARRLLTEDVPVAASGRAQLLKLGVKGLPVGAHAGIADEPVLRFGFGHILRQT
jgi:hypothetical protein